MAKNNTGDHAMAVIVFIWLLLAPPAVWATSGTLLLTSSLTLTENHYGNILIRAGNVTLDCAGFTVFGPGQGGFSGGIDVGAGLTNVTVKRCSVTGFTVNGIFSGGGATNGRFEANHLYGNGNHGMHLDTGSGYIVIGNESRSNGGIGIVLTGATRSWIVRNTVHENQNWAGIGLLNGSHDNVIANNTSVRNSIGYVLDGATGNELSENRAVSNATQGFLLIRQADNNVLKSNSASRNLEGFAIVTGSNSNQLRENEANQNASVGIKIYQSNENALTENVANANGDIGFLVFGGSSFTTVEENTGHHNASYDALDDDLGTGNVWQENHFGTTSGF